MAWKTVEQILRDQSSSFFTPDVIGALSSYNTLVTQMGQKAYTEDLRMQGREKYLTDRINNINQQFNNFENVNDPKFYDKVHKQLENLGKAYKVNEYPGASERFTDTMRVYDREFAEFGVYQNKMKEFDENWSKGVWKPTASYWVGKTDTDILVEQGRLKELRTWLVQHKRDDPTTLLNIDDGIADLNTLLRGAVANDGIINEKASFYHAMEGKDLSDALVDRRNTYNDMLTKVNKLKEHRLGLIEELELVTLTAGHSEGAKLKARQAVDRNGEEIKRQMDNMKPFGDAYFDKTIDWGGYEEGGIPLLPDPKANPYTLDNPRSSVPSTSTVSTQDDKGGKLSQSGYSIDAQGKKRKLPSEEKSRLDALVNLGYFRGDENVVLEATDLRLFNKWASGDYWGEKVGINEYFKDHQLFYDRGEQKYKVNYNMSNIYNMFSEGLRSHTVNLEKPLSKDDYLVTNVSYKSGINRKIVHKYLERHRKSIQKGQKAMRDYELHNNVKQPTPVSPKAKGIQSAWNTVKEFLPKVNMDTYHDFAGKLIQTWMDLPQSDKDKYGDDFDKWIETQIPIMREEMQRIYKSPKEEPKGTPFLDRLNLIN